MLDDGWLNNRWLDDSWLVVEMDAVCSSLVVVWDGLIVGILSCYELVSVDGVVDGWCWK